MLAVTSYGCVRLECAAALTEIVRFNERAGLKDVMVTFISGGLVEKSRDEAVNQMLHAKVNGQPLGWLLFVDADMVPPPNICDLLLSTAFSETPWADVVGAYCQLRGKPFLATCDFGSGLWEPTDPMQGPLEVIRTGAACILIKRHVFERMTPPWYKVRPAPRAIDMLTEVDNFARIKMDGQNPLRDHPVWATLEKCAAEDATRQHAQNPNATPHDLMSAVGEDSSFSDKARALGFRIVVQTNAVVGHIDHYVITPQHHIDSMHELEAQQRLAVGVLS